MTRKTIRLTEKQKAATFVAWTQVPFADLCAPEGLQHLREPLLALGFQISEYENYLGQRVCNLRFDYVYGHSERRSSEALALMAAAAHAHDFQYEAQIAFATWPSPPPWIEEEPTGSD
jgi:hypothetical protein